MSKAAELAALIGSQTALSNRNLIINGAMQVFQRATAATAANNTFTTVDRFRPDESTDGAYTTEQSTDTPTGSGFSLKAQVTTADTSIAATQFALIQQTIEAQNCQSLEYGTSTAKALTLSFFVKSSKTGIYTFVIRKIDSTTYHFVHEYTINSANTWEKKTITILPTAGSTSFITSSGGSIVNDNGQGLQLNFNLAFGSTYNGATNNAWSSNTNHYATSNQVNWMDSTSNNFYLTQVQLEVGEQATPFEHRSFGDELARCQRYFTKLGGGTDAGAYTRISVSQNESATRNTGAVTLPVQMRAEPTLVADGNFAVFANATITATSSITINSTGSDNGTLSLIFDVASGLTAGHGAVQIGNNDATANIKLDAEL